MLRTGVLRAKYTNTDVGCALCTKGAAETLQLVILECAGLQQVVPCGGHMVGDFGLAEIPRGG